MTDYRPYAVHGPGGYRLVPSGGWYVDSVEIGANPNDHSGSDYSEVAGMGIRVIARLNYSHHGEGTIPDEARYEDFALRCANWVRASKGVYCIAIGNEPNYRVEWYGGKTITPQMYASCYRSVWQQVSAVSSVFITHAAVAPWNVDAGSWLDYFDTMLSMIGHMVDFINLHTYTHGTDPNLIYSDAKMDAPYDKCYYNFKTFEDFLAKIPELVNVPVLITETDQNEPWANINSGWVKNAYSYINTYNQGEKHFQVVCLALYRWAEDKWEFQSKQGVQADYSDALRNNYSYTVAAEDEGGHTVFLPSISTGTTPMPPTTTPEPNTPLVWDSQLDQRGVTLVDCTPAPGSTYANLIEGQYYDKQEAQGRVNAYFDFVDEKGNRTLTDEKGAPIIVLVTWQDGSAEVRLEAKPGEPWAGSFIMGSPGNPYSAHVTNYLSDEVKGFGLGDISPEDRPYKIHVAYGFRFQRTHAAQSSAPPPPPPSTIPEQFNEGDKVRTVSNANIRRTPGLVGKTNDDVVGVLPIGSSVMLMDGPMHRDGMPWWAVSGRDGKILGYIAEWYADHIPMFTEDSSNSELYLPGPTPTPPDTSDDREFSDYLTRVFSRVLGIDPKLAHAFIDVESGGRSYGGDSGPLIRFEAHVFRNLLKNNAAFDKYFRVDEADPINGQYWRPSPDVSWQPIHTGSQIMENAAFNIAKSLNRDAAFDSISMGLGQVMGFNHDLLSYPNSEAMYNDFGDEEYGYLNQLSGFFAYIQNRDGMLQAVRNKDFAKMALLYNGSPSYEPLLRNAYAKQTA